MRAGGYIEFGARTFGIVRFYDPRAARQSQLFASNIRVKHTDLQLAVSNTSDAPVTIAPEILPSTREGAQPHRLVAMTIPPHRAVRIDTSRIDWGNAERASVRILNDGPHGSAIGYVAAIDRTSLVAYEAPLREAGPKRQSTGNYPWRLDGDYSSIASIANVGSTTAVLSAVITYAGGVYKVRPETLPAGATATFELRDIRDGQVPGLDGGVLPPDVEKGQFKWSIGGPLNDARLNGRMEIVSRRTGQSSSYSCGQCCPDSFNYGILQPLPVWTPTGWSTQFTVLSQLRTCSGSVGGQLYAYADSWDVFTPSVASVNTTGWGSADANGFSGGETYVVGHWTGYVYEPFVEDCHEIPVDGSGDGQVKVQTPTSLRVASDQYLWQVPNSYLRQRIYEVLDQNGQVITRPLPITENYSAYSSNGCNLLQPQIGSGTTTQGRFADDYYLSNAPGCQANPSCRSTATQTTQASGLTVGTFTVSWGCNDVTVTP